MSDAPPTPRLTKRQAITGAGGLLACGGATAALLTSGTDDARAALSGLSVSDASKTLGPDGTIDAVQLSVSVSYDWSASHQPTAARIELFVAPPGDSFAVLDTLTLTDPGLDGAGTADLSGDVLSLSAFDAAAFDAPAGQTTTTDVEIKAVLTLERDGKRIGVADAGALATVMVTREELTVSAQVNGSGTLAVRTG